MTANNFDLIFERWKADLKNKDRTIDAVYGNFEELFNDLRVANATFQEAHSYLANAIKAHLPPSSLIKNTYRKIKSSPSMWAVSEKDFTDKWNGDISDFATNAFHDTFPLPKEQEDDGGPKVYGNNKITEREYRLLRSHANQFESIDLKSLEVNSSELLTEEELLELVRNNKNG